MSEICRTYRSFGREYITICHEEPELKQEPSSVNEPYPELKDMSLEELLQVPVCCPEQPSFFERCEMVKNECACWDYRPFKMWK